jgi:hypothetical protein
MVMRLALAGSYALALMSVFSGNCHSQQPPITIAAHVIAPVDRTGLQAQLRDYFEKHRTDRPGLGSYAAGDQVAAYSDNPVGFAQFLTSTLKGALPESEGWPEIRLGLVCVYNNKEQWQRVRSEDKNFYLPESGITSVYDIANAINVPGQRTLNVIVVPIIAVAGETILSDPVDDPMTAATFPANHNALRDSANHDRGVVVTSLLFTRLPNDSAFNEGKYIVHEAGHWLGLSHPFDNASNCPDDDYRRQYADEYPHFQRGQRFGETFASGRVPRACGGPEPVHNYMSYTADRERREFNQGQIGKMKRTLESLKTTASENELQCKEGEQQYPELRRPTAPRPPSSVDVN